MIKRAHFNVRFLPYLLILPQIQGDFVLNR